MGNIVHNHSYNIRMRVHYFQHGFSIEQGSEECFLQKREIIICDKVISSYCEAFVVLSSQRIQAAIIGVRQKSRPDGKSQHNKQSHLGPVKGDNVSN